MTLRTSINEFRRKVFQKVINKKQIKRIVILTYTLHLTLLVSAYLIAALFSGYSFMKDAISLLSDPLLTPFPFIIDICLFSMGILLFPYFFYLEHYFTPDLCNVSRMEIRIIEAGFIFGLMAAFSYLGVGIFSIYRHYFIHKFFADTLFLGLVMNAFFYGIFILLYDTAIPKIIGAYGSFGLLIGFGIYQVYEASIIEWIFYILILIWLISLSFFVIRKDK